MVCDKIYPLKKRVIMENGKLKVLQFCDNFYPQIDGVIKVVDKSTVYLKKNCDVKVVVPKYRHEDYDDSVFPYEVLRKQTNSVKLIGYIVPFPKYTRKFNKLIKSMDVDILHVHSPFFLGKYAMRLAKKKNIPIVATFHSQFKKDTLAITHSRLIAWFMTRKVVKFFSKCTEAWAPSNATAKIMREYGFKKDIFVMENGTEFTYPENAEQIIKDVRSQYGIKEENKNLLFVGQMRDVKNIPLILESVKTLVSQDKSYQLFLVGEGAHLEKYKAFVKNNGLEEHVHFLGKIANPSLLAGVYGACDLFYFPSSYDNAPIVVREACIMKTPCLLSEGATAAEPITDGVNGYLAKESAPDMAEKILEIFSNREKMIEIGKEGSKIPITFEEMAENTLNRYNFLIDKYKKEHQK